MSQGESSKVPVGHHPRGTTLHEALKRVSSRVLRGSAGLWGFCGGPSIFPRIMTLCFFDPREPLEKEAISCKFVYVISMKL